MRKTILTVITIGLLVCVSCRKVLPAPAGGSWTFEGMSYTVTTCAANASLLTASSMTDTSNTSYSTVVFSFFNTFPAANGSYRVASGPYPQAAGEVGISLSIDGTYDVVYTSTGGNSNNQMVTVTVSDGKVTVKGTGIEMKGTSYPPDSGALDLSITQLR